VRKKTFSVLAKNVLGEKRERLSGRRELWIERKYYEMQMTTFTQTIKSVEASKKAGARAFLSCSYDDANRTVDLWVSDDASGRQRWVLAPVVPHAPNAYVVTVSGGRGGAKVLSASADGVVDLWAQNDYSGRQVWEFAPISGRTFEISIAGGKGLNAPASKFLTLDPKTGILRLAPRASASAARDAQRWICEDAAPPAPPSGSAKVFLGGAFETGVRDLAFSPAGWPAVAPKTAFWLHPMSVGVAKDGGWLPTLLSRFGKKEFAYEMDLLAWSDGTNPIQTSQPSFWGDLVIQADPSYVCRFYCPWVAGDRLANQLDDTRNRYAQIRGKMDAAGYRGKGYFFYAPPCPESIMNADALLNNRREGMCYVEYVTRAAELKGICIDFPGNLYLASQYPASFPAGSADKCRALAKQAHDVARKLGLPFAWCFNGGESGQVIAAALDSAKRNGIVPDVISIDNFADPNRRGTPESDDNSISGQTLAALKWLGL
jgi:hypothetical protein